MFIFALLLGLYAYLIFFLGILGWLYEWVVVWMTIAFAILSHQVIRSSSHKVDVRLKTYYIRRLKSLVLSPKSRVVVVFGSLLALQACVNLIGVLGPELGFDALWYHLTLPKLYLLNHSIDFIPGGLLYYSAMPKLAEMLYTAGLAFGNENTVKFIHYLFGLLTCLALYKVSRKFVSPLFSLIAVVIFYSNLVVGWESTSAYIDLVRAFFEVMALWAFVEWTSPQPSPKRRGSYKWFVLSALMMGLAITTKVLAIGSLVIFMILIIFGLRLKTKDLRLKTIFSSYVLHLASYVFIALAVPLPWFIFSYLHTGNPVYPFFTDIYKVVPEPLRVVGFVREVWVLFTQASDPLSYVYILFLPVGGYLFIRKVREIRKVGGTGVIAVYALLAIVIWYFTPRTGGGRFILPYLPALSLLCAFCIQYFWKNGYIRRVLLAVVIVAAVFSIGYRSAANWKYVPVIVGKETKAQFLADHLHFAYGDFYDVDGYFAKTIKPTDTVLLYGFHNLYYVDFPFIDSSWVKENDKYTYIAVQKGSLPEKYDDWKLVYQNDRTMVKLYKKN